MKYSLEHEDEVAPFNAQKILVGLFLTEVDFVNNPRFPRLGFRPDRKVYDL